jgi:hypothetical protein
VKPDAVSEFILEHRDGLFDETTLDAWVAKRKEDRPHRFIGDGAVIDPALIAAAKSGNMTARSKVFVALGKDQAALDALLAAPAPDAKKLDADPAYKGNGNPWRPENWSITSQGRIIRTLGVAVAERMARAANSRIGATKPSRAA